MNIIQIIRTKDLISTTPVSLIQDYTVSQLKGRQTKRKPTKKQTIYINLSQVICINYANVLNESSTFLSMICFTDSISFSTELC